MCCKLCLFTHDLSEHQERRQYFDYESIRADLSSVDWGSIFTNSDTNSAWTLFKTTIEEVTTKHIPLKLNRNIENIRCAQSPLWLDKNARLAIQKKNKYWKKYKYSRSPIAYQKYASSRQECAKTKKY